MNMARCGFCGSTLPVSGNYVTCRCGQTYRIERQIRIVLDYVDLALATFPPIITILAMEGIMGASEVFLKRPIDREEKRSFRTLEGIAAAVSFLANLVTIAIAKGRVTV